MATLELETIRGMIDEMRTTYTEGDGLKVVNRLVLLAIVDELELLERASKHSVSVEVLRG